MLRLQVVFFILVLSSIRTQELQISVFYEALCPDSIKFVLHQLYPHISDVKKYVQFDLVPFGKAHAFNNSGHWHFECQHGPMECFQNMVHSCAIALTSSIDSLRFINCVMRVNPNFNNSLEMCASYGNISWPHLKECFNSDDGIELLLRNAAKTKSVTPPITFIPTITFDGVNDESLNDEARENFLQVVCKLLKNRPTICKSLDVLYNILLN